MPGAELFDPGQRGTLAALCDTFIPALGPPDGDGDPHGFWARSASDARATEQVEAALADAQLPDEVVLGLRELLDALAANGLSAAAPAQGSTASRSARATSCSSRRTRWAPAAWAAIGGPRSPTPTGSCTTRPGSGSATRAPFRPRRGPTRC